jgi:protein-ribulosamine 3-kinase
MSLWNTIEKQIATTTGRPFRVDRHSSVGGGCINSAYRIEGDGQRYFVKMNSADQLHMFEVEADGLYELANANAIRVPEPICFGIADNQAYLVMELLELGGSGRQAELGCQLAALHRTTCDRFGWFRDNIIGATHQPNKQSSDWVDFWREQRLGFQLGLAARRGFGSAALRKGEELLDEFGQLFSNYSPPPSLLHGDLWGGNYAFTRDGDPVIFDPAVYYGDREADLAMTELFGGFGGDFYAAYEEAWPLDPGYAQRKMLYNLYHILNHYNLFGGGYGAQAEGMMDRLLSVLHQGV